jgi:hypothetical protein
MLPNSSFALIEGLHLHYINYNVFSSISLAWNCLVVVVIDGV